MSSRANLLLLAVQSTREVGKVRSSQRLRKMQQKRWKLMLMAMSVVIPVCCESVFRNPRLVWMLPRSSNWWEDIVINNFGPHDWIQNFRMSKELFFLFV